MLYINGERANKFHNILHSIYFESSQIKKTIVQYKLFAINISDDTRYFYKKYPLLFPEMLEGMRYRIIIGMGNMFDNDNKSLSINKLLNIFEQIGSKTINKLVKDTRKSLYEYADLKNNIKELRDKIFAHIDMAYLLNDDDSELEFEFLNNIINQSEKLLSYIMDVCVELSSAYDNDYLNLKISRMYEK